MICSKCGSQNSDESKFCATCGQESISETAATNAPIEITPSTILNENSVEESVANESVNLSPDLQQTIQSPDEAVLVKPKRKTGLIILAICIVVAIILSVVVYLVYPKVKMAAMGPEKYYAMQEKAYIEEHSEDLIKLLNASMNTPYSNECKFTLNSDGSSMIPQEIKDMLKKISLNGKSNYDYR